MDDAGVVRSFERFGNLCRDVQGLVERERTSDQTVGERRPLDELEDERAARAHILQAVDLCDARMIERGERLRFAREPRQAIAVIGNGVGQHLQRDVPAEASVTRLVDLAHAARAEERADGVGAE